MTNQEIARLLKKIAAAYLVKNENRFKIMAYERAADSLENTPIEAKGLWQEGKLDEIQGIGPSIAGHLDELFKKGKIRHFEQVLKGLPEAMFSLLALPGFGPKKAYKLAKVLKLKSAKTAITDLEKAAKKGKIAVIEGFGEKSQQDILESLKSFKKGQLKENRINLPLASALATEIISYLKLCPQSLRIDPLGSLRRQVATIGDIDIAVATQDPQEVIDWFIKYPRKQKLVEKGPTGASLLLHNGRQVDLRVQKPKAYGAMLQYFTGSKNHNVHLRELALKHGLSLSEYGIKKLGKNHKINEYKDEESFYQAVGLPLIPPELRENTGEIEAALRQAQNKPDGLPNLVKLDDIKGDLHLHSDFPIEPSHDLGVSSMEEIIEKAESLGYEYLAFSEHAPSVSQHSKEQIFSILSRRRAIIEQLKLTTKIVRVINLLEVDILTDGNLSIEKRSLALLDGVIASVHSGFQQNKEQMTKRILRALENPQVKILGHPTGRLLGRREGYEVDWEEIFAFCQKHGKALEINAWPERLDLPDF
ncbi:helix-hairpin-helix domain-containing protein, partial [Patescibacteria group bacterium]|nr:helix-hairpin-helix domain-containing protein [Patescibacteria group bacterium]